jgi:hypothetical protein
MKKYIVVLSMLACGQIALAQNKKVFKGMYLQWGYNTEWYTQSNIHFRMSNGNDFTLHNVRAKDKPDLDAVYKSPGDISIPQYNYRIGFYLNKSLTRSIELNFDHAKYVVTDFQKVRVTGIIDKQQIDADSILNPETFLHLEHTDGANWLHLNYAEQISLMQSAKKQRDLLRLIWKAGAGINIPRTDFTWKGERFNNNFHIAGYNISVEAGLRYYFSKRFFLESTLKSGYVRYINALANTGSMQGNRVRHGFGYLEWIGTLGYDIVF